MRTPVTPTFRSTGSGPGVRYATFERVPQAAPQPKASERDEWDRPDSGFRAAVPAKSPLAAV